QDPAGGPGAALHLRRGRRRRRRRLPQLGRHSPARPPAVHVRLRRWSAPAALALVAIASLWIATGFGVYLALAAHRSTLADQVSRPETRRAGGTPLQRLPGTLYLVQGGTLYRLQHGTFTRLLGATRTATWTMPAVSPGGQSLVVVRRDYA